MTTYRLMDGAGGRPGPAGPALTAYTSTPFEAGTLLKVTQGGMWADSFFWWVPSGGDTAPQKFCLFNVTGAAGDATVVPGSTVTSGTLTADAWNEVALPSPVQMAIGATYCPATAWTPAHGFPDTNNQFGTGDPYSAGITNGPLQAFGDDTSGGTNGAPYSYPQGLFGTSHADPTAGMPTGGSNASNFWIDLKVDDTAPPGYSGSWRLWPNMGDALGWMLDLAHNYILGTEFILSQACTLDKVWFYSPPGAGQLPTDVAVWDVASQTMVSGTHQSSPTWSGAAGSGWISVSYGVTLPAGDYKASVFNGAATPQAFNATTVNYFTTGPGASGITSGPVTCPDAATATSPGQCTFQDTTGSPSFVYPDLYVAGEGQNYWLDVEVTPVAGTAHTAAASLAVAPSFTAGRSRGQFRTGALPVAPVFSAARAAGHVRRAQLLVAPGFQAAPSGGQLPAAATGSWWGLDNVFKQSQQEFQAFISRPPMACPLCGEPLRNPPNTAAGAGVGLYCKFDGWQYPRDYIRPVRL